MQNNYSNENYAGFWVRFAAYLIDSVIVAAGLLVVRFLWIGIGAVISGTILDGNILFHYSLKDIVLYIFKVMYFILLTWCTGTTIGKRLMNLRVVPADRNQKLSFFDVLYRETIGRFLCGISIWIGYIIIGLDKEKRGFHDMLCDTRVIYEKKVKVYPESQAFMQTQVPVQHCGQPEEQKPEQQVPVQQVPVQQAPVQQVPVQPQSAPETAVKEPKEQSYRAVPDGGYQFVEDAGGKDSAFTQADAENHKAEVKEEKSQEGDS